MYNYFIFFLNILRRYLCFAAADVMLGEGDSLLQPSTKTDYVLVGLAVFVSIMIEREYWKENDREQLFLEVPKNLKQKAIFGVWVLLKILYNYLIIGVLQIIFLKSDSLLKPNTEGEYFIAFISILCSFPIAYFYQRKRRSMV